MTGSAKFNPVLIAALLLSVIALGLAIQARRVQTAEQSLTTATDALVTLHTDAAEITRLRDARETVSTGQRPTQDVIAQVNAVLIEAGIPTQRLRSLTEVSNTALSGGSNETRGDRLRSQVMALQLEALNPTEIGRFLADWRAHQDLWSISRIELIHHRGTASRNRSNSASAETDQYDTQLWMTAVYVAQP